MGQLYEIGQIVEYVDLIDREGKRKLEFPISETAKWFCAVTNPGCQSRAALGLHELGYRTFYPKVRRWVSHARVKKAKEKPLLGRYLFVEVDHPHQSFGLIRTVNGIEGIVSNPDPLPIPSMLVQSFMERYLYGEWDLVRQEACPYYDKFGDLQTRVNDRIPIGARIKIIEGEFNDMLATVTSRKSGKLHCKLLDTNIYTQLREYGVRAA